MNNERTVLLLGQSAFDRLQDGRVTVAGLGGVGGHCAEALARAGVGRLHLIDFDTVTESNMNRQLVATKATLGMKKTAAMRERLETVSDCIVTAAEGRIGPDTVETLLPEETGFIVDAIDQMSGKLALIRFAISRDIPIVSCLGAGNRLDASAFSVRDIFSTEGDPLARRLRSELRKMGVTALPVVFSNEAPHTAPGQKTIGSLAPVTAAAGLVAAAYVIRRLAGEDLFL